MKTNHFPIQSHIGKGKKKLVGIKFALVSTGGQWEKKIEKKLSARPTREIRRIFFREIYDQRERERERGMSYGTCVGKIVHVRLNRRRKTVGDVGRGFLIGRAHSLTSFFLFRILACSRREHMSQMKICERELSNYFRDGGKYPTSPSAHI